MAPLVSIGIPVSDRIEGLSATIDSILAQTLGEFEVILVDDTGRDELSDICTTEADRDSRIGYVKTPGRFGVLPSHAEALARSAGTYFMWLGVGDRLDRKFLEICIGRLEARTDLALAVGRTSADGQDNSASLSTLNVSAGDPVRRVEGFLESEVGLDLWYGVFRRSVIADIQFRNAIGFELAFLAEVAFSGKIESVEDAWCERGGVIESEPVSEDDGEIEDTLGVSAFQWNDPYLVLGVQLFCNIAFLSETFASLPQVDRLRLAVRAYSEVVKRWPIQDESQFISFAVRVFPESRVTERLHEIRLFIARTLYSESESKSLFEPLSRAEEIINGLGRIKIGRLPATQAEREVVGRIRKRFDRTNSDSFKNRAVLALSLFL